MNSIQAVLLTGVAFIFVYFVVRLKKRLFDLALLFLMIACAVTFILFPDITTKLANKINEGRGADLIFYLSILIFWFVILKLYTRIRRLEQQFTSIIRNEALKNANEPKDKSA